MEYLRAYLNCNTVVKAEIRDLICHIDDTNMPKTERVVSRIKELLFPPEEHMNRLILEYSDCDKDIVENTLDIIHNPETNENDYGKAIITLAVFLFPRVGVFSGI